MNPLIGAAAVGAASDVLGGFLGRDYNENRMAEDQRFQKEVMQNAVTWRVEDAKRAGLHPLFAMGANVSTGGGSPQFIGDPLSGSLSSAGQNISNAIARTQTQDERLKNQMDLAISQKSIEESDARIGFIRAQQRQLEQASASTGTGQMSESNMIIPGQNPNIPGIGIIDLKPNEQTSAKGGSPHVAAGAHPWFQENVLAGGRLPFQTPRGQGEHPEELLSEMSFPAYLGLLKQNEATYGEGWLTDFLKYRYLGIPPSHDYSTRFGTPAPGGSMYVPQSGVSGAIRRALDPALAAARRYKKKWNEFKNKLP